MQQNRNIRELRVNNYGPQVLNHQKSVISNQIFGSNCLVTQGSDTYCIIIDWYKSDKNNYENEYIQDLGFATENHLFQLTVFAI